MCVRVWFWVLLGCEGCDWICEGCGYGCGWTCEGCGCGCAIMRPVARILEG